MGHPEEHAGTAAVLIPPKATLPHLRLQAADCHACPLWRRGTQTVFGEGAARAPLLFVGEQPGDHEDKQGRPFVGPAGRILDEALAALGIDRKKAYVTNAVKHFKWEPRGKRRIHQKPNAMEIAACKPWLIAEIELVRPKVVVCLGATAAQALLGRQFRVTESRGKLMPFPVMAAADLTGGGATGGHPPGVRRAMGRAGAAHSTPHILATVHPSSILRAPDDDTRRDEKARFIQDLSALVAFV